MSVIRNKKVLIIDGMNPRNWRVLGRYQY